MTQTVLADAIESVLELPHVQGIGKCMPAYVIAQYDEVLDQDALSRYRILAAQSVEAFGGRYIVRGNIAGVAIEGDWAPRYLVIIAFADLATAKAWYSSDAYAPALALRQMAGRRALTIVDGVDTP